MTEANTAWSVDHDGPSLPIIVSGSQVIALVKTTEDHAHLIAAAPELLSLLQDAVDSFGPHIEGGDDEWLQFAKSAIAKATGSAL